MSAAGIEIYDRVARVFTSVAFITLSIPIIFFTIIVKLEKGWFGRGIKSYVYTRCAWVGPWTNANSTSFSKAVSTSLPTSSPSTNTPGIVSRSIYIALVVSCLSIAIAITAWAIGGRQSIMTIVFRSLINLGIFFFVDVGFAFAMLRDVPPGMATAMDIAGIQQFVAASKTCLQNFTPGTIVPGLPNETPVALPFNVYPSPSNPPSQSNQTNRTYKNVRRDRIKMP